MSAHVYVESSCCAEEATMPRPRPGLGYGYVGKVNRPTMFFYLAVATSTAKISLGRNVSIFMKRETLQKRHKQSNKHVFRLCLYAFLYVYH